MSVSRLVLGGLVTAVFATAMGCKVDVSTKTRYTEPNIEQDDDQDWTGQPIKINIQGVGVAVNGGINVEANPNATKVTANARFLAMAFEKADADQSIIDAKATFKVTHTADQILVECGHGESHGESNGGESGCELVNLVVPAGTAEQPLDLEVLGGNGTMTLQLRNAVLENLGTNNQSDISAEVPATVGGTVSLVSEQSGDIGVTLPAGWTADSVILQADNDKISNPYETDATAPLSLTQTPGTNEHKGTRGTAGTGLALLKVTSKEFAGSTGTITLR